MTVTAPYEIGFKTANGAVTVTVRSSRNLIFFGVYVGGCIGVALRVGFGLLRVNGQALELQKPFWALAPILEIGVV